MTTNIPISSLYRTFTLNPTKIMSLSLSLTQPLPPPPTLLFITCKCFIREDGKRLMCDQTSVVSICDDMNVDLIIIKLYTDPSDHHHRCLLHLLLGCPPNVYPMSPLPPLSGGGLTKLRGRLTC